MLTFALRIFPLLRILFPARGLSLYLVRSLLDNLCVSIPTLQRYNTRNDELKLVIVYSTQLLSMCIFHSLTMNIPTPIMMGPIYCIDLSLYLRESSTIT